MQRILPQMSCTRGPTPTTDGPWLYTRIRFPQCDLACLPVEHVRVSQSLPLAVSWALTAAEESAPGLSRQLSELAGEVKAEVLRLGTRPQ